MGKIYCPVLFCNSLHYKFDKLKDHILEKHPNGHGDKTPLDLFEEAVKNYDQRYGTDYYESIISDKLGSEAKEC